MQADSRKKAAGQRSDIVSKPQAGQKTERKPGKSSGVSGLPDKNRRSRSPRNLKKRLAQILGFVLLVGLMVTGGAMAGYQSGQKTRLEMQSAASAASTGDQYELGLQDMAEGRFEVARQRFEFVLSEDPNHAGAAENLVLVMQVLFATSTPTQPPPTTTPTPTRDMRPVQDLFDQGRSLVASGDWDGGIETLLALRKEDPDFQVAKVDGLLFLALRNRGVQKIMESNDLEGGTYDLALAERFGPLDVRANQARSLARLYMFGSSFWEAYPERAVYFFQQVAAAAPYLRDASGWTAMERYRGALIQYGDQLAGGGEWCLAEEQYNLALSIRVDESLQEKAREAAEACAPPTATPEPATATPTETITPTLELSPTATFQPIPATETPTVPPATPTETVPAPTTPPVTETAPPATTEAPPTATPTVPPETTEPPPATTEPPPATTEPVEPTAPAQSTSPPPETETPQPDPTETTADPTIDRPPTEQAETAVPAAPAANTAVPIFPGAFILALPRWIAKRQKRL